MQVNVRNVNFEVRKNPHVSGVEVNGKLKKVNYFIRAWNRNEAITKAIDKFKWDYPWENVIIDDIRVELWSDGYGYAKNYYKVTITYTYEGKDNNWGGLPYLPW